MKRPFALALAAMLNLGCANAFAAAPASMNMTVDPHWLESRLSDPSVVVLHIGRKEDFAAGHIPGARLITFKDIAVDSDGATMQLPPPDELKRKLGAIGIGNDSKVVVSFGKDWVSPATRVIFTMQAAGLGKQVALLDGGLEEWRRQGKPTTTSATAAAAAPASAGPELRMEPLVVDAGYVRKHAGTPGVVLVDARAPVYYEGVERSGHMAKLRKGHIPGAVNIPFSQVSGLDHKMRSPAQLAELFRASGIKPGTRLIVYCHIGQQATAVIFAARAAGIDAVLYDGSFEDWTWNDGPVEAMAARK